MVTEALLGAHIAISHVLVTHGH